MWTIRTKSHLATDEPQPQHLPLVFTLDPAQVRGVGRAQPEQHNPFIIILPRRDTVNQRDNLPANKLQGGGRGGEE